MFMFGSHQTRSTIVSFGIWHYCKQLPIKHDPTSLKSEGSHAGLILYFQWLGLVSARSQHFQSFYYTSFDLILDFLPHTETNPRSSINRII